MSQSQENLEKQILATICFFDTLEYPLTLIEIHKNLLNTQMLYKSSSDVYTNNNINNPSILDIQNTLENSERLKNMISCKRGFYFLKGNGCLVDKRLERNRIAIKKWKKVRWISSLFQMVPFVRMIAVSGNLSLSNTPRGNDLDIFIITKYGRIWTARFLMLILIYLTGFKRSPKKFKDKICPNHFITDESLIVSEDNLYSAILHANLVPVLDSGTLDKFKKENLWINKYLVNYPLSSSSLHQIHSSKFLKGLKYFSEVIFSGHFGNWFETVLCRILTPIQLKRAKSQVLDKNNAEIVVNERQIILHPRLRSQNIVEGFRKRLGDRILNIGY